MSGFPWVSGFPWIPWVPGFLGVWIPGFLGCLDSFSALSFQLFSFVLSARSACPFSCSFQLLAVRVLSACPFSLSFQLTADCAIRPPAVCSRGSPVALFCPVGSSISALDGGAVRGELIHDAAPTRSCSRRRRPSRKWTKQAQKQKTGHRAFLRLSAMSLFVVVAAAENRFPGGTKTGKPSVFDQEITPWRFFQCHRPVSTPSAIKARTAELGSGTDESWMAPRSPSP